MPLPPKDTPPNNSNGEETGSGKQPAPKGRRGPREAWRAFAEFAHAELWDADLASLPKLKKAAVSTLRLAVIVVRGVLNDRCTLQSAALSYITLVSLVPLLALMFALSRGLGAHQRIMGIVEENLENLPENTAEFLSTVLDLVDRVNYGALGTIGLLVIFLSAVGMLSKIETTFNTIWGVRKGRSLFRKFTDYISVIVVVPLLMLAATSLNTALSAGGLAQFLQENLGALYPLYQQLIGLSGILMLCLAFAFLYMFMPNTNVRFLPALAAGLVGAVLWFLLQRAYIELQIGVTSKNAIYGTFAAIPFFLTWLYASWLIVLLGAEICFGMQNLHTYALENAALRASLRTQELIALAATYRTCRVFLDGDAPWDAAEFARKHEVPARLMTTVANVLVDSGILATVECERGAPARYLPARDPAQLTPKDVLTAFHGEGDAAAVRTLEHEAPPAFQSVFPVLNRCGEELAKCDFRALGDSKDGCTPQNA